MSTQVNGTPPPSDHRRGVFCNRTLNLRSIRAVGFDMDYTLIHYRTEAWERTAYSYAKQRLVERGWPLADLEFDPELVALGLVVDVELGNVVKADRFGYVKRACHGTRMLEFEEQRRVYSRLQVDLSEPRWVFLNTLFGLSEGCLYLQLVDLLDRRTAESAEGSGPLGQAAGYAELYRLVRASVDETHLEGQLKADIVANPDRFVELDPELPLALLDLQNAGKKVLLITNSEWSYTQPMMSYAVDRYLPKGKTWRDLFELVILQARKPSFFTQRNALFEMVSDDGLLKPTLGRIARKGIYVGGDAGLVEQFLGLPGEEILFIGDHVFADVHVSKNLLRWRTALVVRELEEELGAVDAFGKRQEELARQMNRKSALEHQYSLCRLELQRLKADYGPRSARTADEVHETMQKVRAEILALDQQITPLARESGQLKNSRWGPLMRAGNDKSHLARQIERYADIYTSRVSNLLHITPFAYLRSPRGMLPHEEGLSGQPASRDAEG